MIGPFETVRRVSHLVGFVVIVNHPEEGIA